MGVQRKELVSGPYSVGFSMNGRVDEHRLDECLQTDAG